MLVLSSNPICVYVCVYEPLCDRNWSNPTAEVLVVLFLPQLALMHTLHFVCEVVNAIIITVKLSQLLKNRFYIIIYKDIYT